MDKEKFKYPYKPPSGSDFVTERRPSSSLWADYLAEQKRLAQVVESQPTGPDLRSALDHLATLVDATTDEGEVLLHRRAYVRTRRFLAQVERMLRDTCQRQLPAPRAMPGPGDGSVDLLWRSDGHEFLFNVPAEENETITFAANDRGEGEFAVDGHVSEGTLRDWMNWLLMAM